MKNFIFLAIIASGACFSWTYINKQSEQNSIKDTPKQQEATSAQKNVDSITKQAASLINKEEIAPTVQAQASANRTSNSDNAGKHTLTVRNTAPSDMENLSERAEKLDKTTYEKTDALLNRKTRNTETKRAMPAVAVPNMASNKYTAANKSQQPPQENSKKSPAKASANSDNGITQ